MLPILLLAITVFDLFGGFRHWDRWLYSVGDNTDILLVKMASSVGLRRFASNPTYANLAPFNLNKAPLLTGGALLPITLNLEFCALQSAPLNCASHIPPLPSRLCRGCRR